MKIKLLAAAVTLLSTSTLPAQVFDAGYTFTSYFDTLPTWQPGELIPENSWSLNGFQALTATIAWEIFDSLSSGAPVISGVWHPGNFGYVILPAQTWQDGEGSFRVTILSGSQVISGFGIYVHIFGSDPATVYSASIIPAPVPEPGAFVFLALGLASAGLWLRRRARTI
jgi:hypothetical protein